MAISAGSDVESICSKCGDVWHVVLAMVETKIARVQCKECGAQHRYRPAGGSAARTKSVRTRKKTAAKKLSASSAATGPAVEPDTRRPTRPYSVKESYEVADRVDHVKFGIGVVEAVEPGKMTVWFPVGRKVLVQARPASKLQKPPRITHDEDSSDG